MEKSNPQPNKLFDPISHPIPNHNADPSPASSFHRRSHSDDMSIFEFMDPFSSDDLPSDEDLFSSFIDVDSFAANQYPSRTNPRHRHSNSVDAIYGTGEIIMEARKVMPPEKLSEFWSIDPKRAKRIVANRQFAVRSKEREARYKQELERRIQSHQTQATILSAQITLCQRETDELVNENREIKLRLQAMKQRSRLRKSLNEALMKKVEMMKIETGEIPGISDSFDMGMQYSFMANPPYHSAMNGQDMQMHRSFNPTEMSSSQRVSEFPQNGRLQEVETSGNSSISLVKSEGSSVSGSESSSEH